MLEAVAFLLVSYLLRLSAVLPDERERGRERETETETETDRDRERDRDRDRQRHRQRQRQRDRDRQRQRQRQRDRDSSRRFVYTNHFHNTVKKEEAYLLLSIFEEKNSVDKY